MAAEDNTVTPRQKRRYAALDRLLGAGVLPDPVLRAATRTASAGVLRRESRGGPEAQQQRLSRLVEIKSNGPIAHLPEVANRQHYELPPEFFDLFLGPRRKYSSCLFAEEATTLPEAEESMLALSCERAQIRDGQRILDLGCGWGSMSLWIAERYPQCRVTGLSNSGPQRRWIMAEAERRGLADRVEIITADVNDFEAEGSFDRVVSIEMFEHCSNWQELMRRISTWLEPDGLCFVHVFTHRLHGYLYTDSWLAERFFTEGVMPSHDLLLHFQDDLLLGERWALNGTHYARTLDSWLDLLDANGDAAMDVLSRVYPSEREAKVALANWRLFLIAATEVWNHDSGSEWLVSHYLFSPRTAAGR